MDVDSGYPESHPPAVPRLVGLPHLSLAALQRRLVSVPSELAGRRVAVKVTTQLQCVAIGEREVLQRLQQPDRPLLRAGAVGETGVNRGH